MAILEKLFHIINKSRKEYQFFLGDFSSYIEFYGPMKDLFYSPYFHISVLISLIVIVFAEETNKWTEYALGALPSILGFSIGGYALIATFGDQNFRKFLAETTHDNKSILLIINGTFIHFILAQTTAILIAFFVKSTNILNNVVNFFAVIPFVYSITMCIAIAFSIMTISKWYKDFLSTVDKN